MALITAVHPDALASFLEDYDVGALLSSSALAAGSVNSNFRLHCSKGDFFLRLYEEQDEAGARRDAETVGALARAGVPTPPPVLRRSPGPSGASLGALNGKPAVLLPWSPGEVLCQKRVTARHAREVGRSLAAMHRSGAALASAYGPGRFQLDHLLARIGRIERAGDVRIAGQAPELRMRLEEIAAARDRKLPGGLAHGDLFRDNVLFIANEAKVAALLDFESAYEGPLVYDLMVTVLAWCVGDALDFDLARAMVEGYESERPLSEEERAHAYDEARFGCMRFWITRVTDYAMRLGFGAGRDPGRFAMRLRAIEETGPAGFRARVFGR